MDKPPPAEVTEATMVAEINEETNKLNGPKPVGTEVATTQMDVRLARIHTGLTEMHAIAAERDEALARAKKAEDEIVNLLNLADQAREGERLRLKEVSDKAITEARASTAMQEVLQGEIDSLRTRLAACEAKVMEAQAETAKYRTFTMMIRASLDKIAP